MLVPRVRVGPNRYHACAVPSAPETHARDRLAAHGKKNDPSHASPRLYLSFSTKPEPLHGGPLHGGRRAHATRGSRSGILHAHTPLGIPRAARHTKCKRCTIPELASTHTPHFEWSSQCIVLCMHAMLAHMHMCGAKPHYALICTCLGLHFMHLRCMPRSSCGQLASLWGASRCRSVRICYMCATDAWRVVCTCMNDPARDPSACRRSRHAAKVHAYHASILLLLVATSPPGLAVPSARS